MKSRRQALKLCLDTAVVVIVKIFDELLFEVFHRIKFLQIEQFAFEQTKEVFYHSIVQTITFPAHALPYAFLAKHPLVLLRNVFWSGSGSQCRGENLLPLAVLNRG